MTSDPGAFPSLLCQFKVVGGAVMVLLQVILPAVPPPPPPGAPEAPPPDPEPPPPPREPPQLFPMFFPPAVERGIARLCPFINVLVFVLSLYLLSLTTEGLLQQYYRHCVPH